MRFFTERRVLCSSYDRGIRATDLLHMSVPCDHRWYGLPPSCFLPQHHNPMNTA